MGSITDSPTLKVAIIGGGPGGLGSAIALSKLPNVAVELFEKATELREIGAGINIGFNCWRVLELLGAADGVKGHLVTSVYHRYVVIFIFIFIIIEGNDGEEMEEQYIPGVVRDNKKERKEWSGIQNHR
jgi:hypothetical protein